MANEDKTILTLQIPLMYQEKLKEIADRECSSISYIVRKLIINYCNTEDKNNGKQ